MKIERVQNHFVNHLPADPEQENFTRQVTKGCFSFVKPVAPSAPELIAVSPEMLDMLGITEDDAKSEEFLQIFSGQLTSPESKPYAMNYAGHQFGHWAGQLGDGRAINLFEIERDDEFWTVQLKGSGPTPYSRSADGFAVLRSSIREYLCSEAMYHLGIPTSRALSLVKTGDSVLRDMMYDGNPEMEQGAIVCRMAPSFLRFGSYELWAARQDHEILRKLTDYTIDHFFPEVARGPKGQYDYLNFFNIVCDRTLDTIVHWQRVGFVHGVMNTDNMSILGLTIDYGPYGWIDDYNPEWTPNTTDRQNRRYRFGNQPSISLWNLVRLANALYPLIGETEGLQKTLSSYQKRFQQKYLQMMREKLGLEKKEEGDSKLVADLEAALQLQETDMTIFFRQLSDIQLKATSEDSFIHLINESLYNREELKDENRKVWQKWWIQYHNRLQREETSSKARKANMDGTNPKYVLRNYMAQEAIDLAEKGDYALIDRFQEMLKKPYEEQPENEKYFAKRPDWAKDKVGCSMLSCSS